MDVSVDFASTEVLVHGESTWSYVGNLPLRTRGLSGVSVNNTVMMTGLGNTVLISLCNL